MVRGHPLAGADGRRAGRSKRAPGRAASPRSPQPPARQPGDVLTELDCASTRTFANNGRFPNVTFAQADLMAPPASPASFQRVFCMGVLQHLPSPDDGFASLATLVSPGRLPRRRLLPASADRAAPLEVPVAADHATDPLLSASTRSSNASFRPSCRHGRFSAASADAMRPEFLPIVSYSQLGIPDDLNRACRSWTHSTCTRPGMTTRDHSQPCAGGIEGTASLTSTCRMDRMASSAEGGSRPRDSTSTSPPTHDGHRPSRPMLFAMRDRGRHKERGCG